MSDRSYGVLGQLMVEGPGGPISLGGPKQRAVLAVLLLSNGLVVEADRLAYHLWGDEIPPSAAGTIQAYVSKLRRALGSDEIERVGAGEHRSSPRRCSSPGRSARSTG